MGGVSLTEDCKNLILEKWNHCKDEICKEFKLSDDEFVEFNKAFVVNDDYDDYFDYETEIQISE